MSVAKFCTCGFQLGHPRPNCPSCGRSLEMTTSHPVLTAVPLPVPPLNLEPLKFEPENKKPRPRWDDGDTYRLNEPDANNPADQLYEDQIAEARRLLRDARRKQRSIAIFFAEPGSFKDCFFYPFKGWVWATLLAFGWSIILVLLTALMPLEQFGIGTVVFAAALWMVLGFSHRLCRYVYESSGQEKASMLGWPGFDPREDLKQGFWAVLAFLAGPLPVLGIAIWFWLNSGRLTMVDRLIVLELVALAFSWWMLTLVVFRDRGAFHPAAIGIWLEKNGMLPLGVIFAGSTALCFILWTLLPAIEILHDFPIFGGFYYTVWLTPVFFVVFFQLRWLGARFRRDAAVV